MKRAFSETKVEAWQEFLEISSPFGFKWFFRGQSMDYPLATSIERACIDNNILLKDAPGIEKQLIRDFSRRYDGDDRHEVLSDKLYCLALMQHHGAPTRLLDVTYSNFVAAFFAIEHSKPDKECIIWCIRGDWLFEQCRTIIPDIDLRDVDDKRNNETFEDAFIEKCKKFVYPENPLYLNRRLTIQQGAFLCPGDISLPFVKNLKAMDGWREKSNIVKLRLLLNSNFKRDAINDLNRMNISRATLFPGLDGFAQSFWQRFGLYKKLADLKMGNPLDHK